MELVSPLHPSDDAFDFTDRLQRATVDVDRADTADLSQALLVHAVGYIHYGGDERGCPRRLGVPARTRGRSAFTVHCGTTSAVGTLPSHPCRSTGTRANPGILASIGIDLPRLLDRK